MRQPELFSIPPHVAFVDALARGLLDRCAGDPLALARTHVLLPNRRATRALTDAFVRLSGNGWLLLPRMTPVGDIGDDSFDRFAGGETPIAPAVPPLQRRLELGRLVRAMPGGREIGRSAVEALRLGDALCETLDALLSEEIDPERLRTVVEDAELATHWQETLAFLDLVITHWPPARDAAGGSDGGTRVAAMIDALVARWSTAPPTGLVVAAGVTGSSPPLVRLLAAVLHLPAGMIVLPGLDMDLSEAAEDRWAAIRSRATGDEGRESEEHPQYALKALLARLALERADVRDWGVASGHDGPVERTPQVMAAMAPADAGDGWSGGTATTGFETVRAVEAATPAEEAQVIALALREALATPGKTAALVTPDRGLARRVAAHCRRWGMMVDDSAGTPLRITPPGALALALVEAMAQGFAPVALLAVLKHPLVHSGDARLPWLRSVRLLDRAVRGVRPPPGLEAIGEQLDRWLADTRRDDAPALNAWWEGAAAQLEPLAVLADRAEIDLPLLVGALRQVGDALCGDRLWSGTDGRALATLVEALETGGASFGRFPVDDAPALLAALLSDIAVRPAYGGHPRLAILGPLEARLQRADLMILGGLNEGTWPGRPSPDPWLAPAIRNRLGLPGLARSIGLAAQDFTGALGAAQVLLTRARRDASAPLVASRFWLRLHAFADIAADDRLLLLARRLDSRGVRTRIEAPAPNPPLARRPHRLSVTEIDTLRGDPFAFYARRMLGLQPLDPLDQDPTAATRGNRIHDVMEDWIKSGGGSLERLERLADAMLDAEGKQFPLLRALWAPRARRGLLWAGAAVHAREAEGWYPAAAEAGGTMPLPNGIVLKGRADRIDRHEDNGLAVIDYKTGRTPTAAEVKGGFASQLGLLLAMAAGGWLGTKDGTRVVKGHPQEVAYWKLSGGKEPGKIVDPLKGKPPMSAEQFKDFVYENAERLTTELLLTETPFRPKVVPGMGWTDFDHLARVREWQDRPRRRR